MHCAGSGILAQLPVPCHQLLTGPLLCTAKVQCLTYQVRHPGSTGGWHTGRGVCGESSQAYWTNSGSVSMCWASTSGHGIDAGAQQHDMTSTSSLQIIMVYTYQPRLKVLVGDSLAVNLS